MPRTNYRKITPSPFLSNSPSLMKSTSAHKQKPSSRGGSHALRHPLVERVGDGETESWREIFHTITPSFLCNQASEAGATNYIPLTHSPTPNPHPLSPSLPHNHPPSPNSRST